MSIAPSECLRQRILNIPRFPNSDSDELDRLREKTVEIFTRKLIEKEGNNLLQVILFGYTATGEYREDTPINIFVLLKEKAKGTFIDDDRIYDIAYDVNLEVNGFKTCLKPAVYALVDYKHCNLLPSIKEEGILLYDAGTEFSENGLNISWVKTSIEVKKPSEEIARIREKTLEIFVEKLKEKEGDNLLQVILYGSVARGDCRDDSDTDVFVLLRDGEKADSETCDAITDIALDINSETGESKTYLSPIVFSLSEYQKCPWEPLFCNIRKEGIILHDSI
jgi:predicted nucleotidyltransferase